MMGKSNTGPKSSRAPASRYCPNGNERLAICASSCIYILTSHMETANFAILFVCGLFTFFCRAASTPASPRTSKRFLEHIAGRGGAYTRSHPPLRIIYKEQAESKSSALRREAEIKHWNRGEKIRSSTRRCSLNIPL